MPDLPATSEAELPASQALGEGRRRLIELLEGLPETRLSSDRPRIGWTLRHDLAWLAAADAELARLLEIPRGTEQPASYWRRVRGEAMHVAQELRLHLLRDHLTESGERAAAGLSAEPSSVDRASVRAALERHREATVTATAVVEEILAR